MCAVFVHFHHSFPVIHFLEILVHLLTVFEKILGLPKVVEAEVFILLDLPDDCFRLFPEEVPLRVGRVNALFLLDLSDHGFGLFPEALPFLLGKPPRAFSLRFGFGDRVERGHGVGAQDCCRSNYIFIEHRHESIKYGQATANAEEQQRAHRGTRLQGLQEGHPGALDPQTANQQGERDIARQRVRD
jgi:hypothetical protein